LSVLIFDCGKGENSQTTATDFLSNNFCSNVF
jgi:hypothetical protein